jgi:hypothetical protein
MLARSLAQLLDELRRVVAVALLRDSDAFFAADIARTIREFKQLRRDLPARDLRG